MGCHTSKPRSTTTRSDTISTNTISVAPTTQTGSKTSNRITPIDINGIITPHNVSRQNTNKSITPTSHTTAHNHLPPTPKSQQADPATQGLTSNKPRKSILRSTESAHAQDRPAVHGRHHSNKSISRIVTPSKPMSSDDQPLLPHHNATNTSSDNLALPPNSLAAVVPCPPQNSDATVRSTRIRRKGRAKSVDATQFYAQQLNAENAGGAAAAHMAHISFDAGNSAVPTAVMSTRVHRSNRPKDKSYDGTPRHSKPPSRRNSKLVRRTSFRGLMNQLALKFPLIRRSFGAVHAVFRRYHIERQQAEIDAATASRRGVLQAAQSLTGSSKHRFDGEAIRMDQLQRVLRDITTHKQIWTDFEVQELFRTADLDNSKTISFREFLIVIAVGYFLKVECDDPQFTKIQAGFKVIQNAFEAMDADKSGTIDLSELKLALFNVGHDHAADDAASIDGAAAAVRKAGMSATNKSVLEQRFKELDFNSDNSIEFAEFLFCIVSWVGFDPESLASDNRCDIPEMSTDDPVIVGQTDAERQINTTNKRASHSHKL